MRPSIHTRLTRLFICLPPLLSCYNYDPSKPLDVSHIYRSLKGTPTTK